MAMKKTISLILALGVLFSITTSAFAASNAPSTFKSDTGAKLTMAQNQTYQFKITSDKKPEFSVGNSSIIKLVSNKAFGHTYYFTIQAVGKAGQSAGVYVNGTRATVCTIVRNTSKIPNPLVNYKTLDEARKAVGFSFAVPTSLPANYQMKDIIVINNNLAEIFYQKGNHEILYRTAKGNADISGNYIVYEEVKTVKVGSINVTVKGKEGLISLATWSKDGISYSLSFDEVCDQKSIASIIESIQ